MRLFDTYTRSLVELPPPPGPIRMYVCGPTVYQRIHIGNARPFVISLWLKRWLEETGYRVLLAENITDINDKIYLAAPGRSAELAAAGIPSSRSEAIVAPGIRLESLRPSSPRMRP